MFAYNNQNNSLVVAHHRHAIAKSTSVRQPAYVKSDILVNIPTANIMRLMSHRFHHQTEISIYTLVRLPSNYSCDSRHTLTFTDFSRLEKAFRNYVQIFIQTLEFSKGAHSGPV